MIGTILAIISGVILLVVTSPIWISILMAVGISLLLVFVFCIVIVGKILWLGWKLLEFIFFTALIMFGFLIVGGAIFYLLKYFRVI